MYYFEYHFTSVNFSKTGYVAACRGVVEAVNKEDAKVKACLSHNKSEQVANNLWEIYISEGYGKH